MAVNQRTRSRAFASSKNSPSRTLNSHSTLEEILAGDGLLLALKDLANAAGINGVPLAYAVRAAVQNLVNHSERFEADPYSLEFRAPSEEEELSLLAAGGPGAVTKPEDWAMLEDGPAPATESAAQVAIEWREQELARISDLYNVNI